jgi:hypothetical protein
MGCSIYGAGETPFGAGVQLELEGEFAPFLPFRASEGERSIGTRFVEEAFVIIQSVELVALPNAPTYQEKIYRAHMDTGENVDLFQQHWDVFLPPESLVGLTLEQAWRKRTEKMLAAASGQH